MKITFTQKFEKAREKMPPKVQATLELKIKLFIKSPNDPVLKNHELKGTLKGYRSINITGDWRALYVVVDKDTISFETIGTHSQLYK